MKSAIQFISKLRQTITGKVKSVALTGYDSFRGIENYGDVKSLSTYKTSLYVYIGVSMIARKVAGIQLDYYRVLNSEGETEEVTNHDIIDLLNNPTPYLTRKEFSELSAMYYLLAGDIFWYLERAPNSNRIINIHPLRPDYVEIVLNAKNDTVAAYRYAFAGNTAVLQPENVVHVKNTDPTNIIRGLGVITPAGTRIVTESEATNYQAKFFKNQGRPDVAVFVDSELTEEQAADGRRRWRDVFGRGEGGQAGFFGKNVKDVKMLNVNPREMDFINTQSFLRDDILAALHIPKAMVTSDDVNLANSLTARINYLQEAVLPVLDAIVDAINHKLLTAVDEALFVRYENPVPEDREIKLKEADTLVKSGILSVNEVRPWYGYGEVEGADALRASNPMGQLQLMQYAKQVLKARPLLRKKLIATEKVQKYAELMVKETPRKRNSIFTSGEQRKAFANAYNKKVDAKATKVELALRSYYKELGKRIVAQNKDGFSTGNFMDAVGEQVELQRTVVPVLQKVLEDAGQEALDALYTPTKANPAGEQFVLSPQLLAKYAERSILFINSTTNTTFGVLQQVVMQGLKEGIGVDDIAARLTSATTDLADWKATQIARTETGYAQSLATSEAYQQSTVVEGKEWITAGDSMVRDEHQLNDGVIVGKNEPFPNGEYYPAQFTINCRCVIAPAL